MGEPGEVRAPKRRKAQPGLNIVPVKEAFVERIADIMGEHSASAKALAELRRRRAAGETVALFRAAGMTLVVPPLAPPPTAGGPGAGTADKEERTHA